MKALRRGETFAGGRDFTSGKLQDIKDCIEHYTGNRYQLEFSVKEPTELKNTLECEGINVDKRGIFHV